MERITIYVRTKKTEGMIKLRFRVRDGKKIDLYHPSEIKADIKHLEKFTDEGNVKPRVSVYNEGLYDAIQEEIKAISQAYNSMVKDGVQLTSEELNRRIDDILHPHKQDDPAETIIKRFERFTEEQYRDDVISMGRIKHYDVLCRILNRFLIIWGKSSMSASAFDVQTLRDFREFLQDEYKYVDSHKRLYKTCKANTIPVERRSNNTCAAKLKILKLFFEELVRLGEITRSPFDMINKKSRQKMLQSKYDVPICMTLEEFYTMMHTDVPDYLQEAKDAFIVHCALGCRISDYKRLSMDNLSVKDGIPYVHYLPQKTSHQQSDNEEIKSPIPLFALDIIKRYRFRFSIINYASGHLGYNEKIKRIMEFAGIARPCAVYNEETGDNEYKPLYELGSSKLARKTYVDRMAKADINIYQSGLHREGSDAAKRYVGDLTIKERFDILCRAFDCKPYRVDNDLNIIEEPQQDTDLIRMVEAMSQDEKARLLALLSAK